MIEVGDILKINGGMTLRVTEIRGTWMKCDYLSDGEWKPRGRTENRKRMEEMVAAGEITVA